jgi:DNA repair exonuclease SbcCD ATPase subunit
LELPFDQFQRYQLVSEIIEELRPPGTMLRILDVGGRTGLLRSFLPRDRVELVDVEPSYERGLVLGDGCALPFRDRAVDVVCGFDTLEHVPPAQRQAFVRECARVARTHVILAGPYHTARVEQAEQLLARFLREKLAYHHRYLEEHRANGLPDRAEVEAELSARGAQVAALGHGNLERWLTMMCLALYMDLDPALRGLAKRFHAFYNAQVFDRDREEPVYRHAVVAAFGGARLPRMTVVPEARPEALQGEAQVLLGRFATELAAFDREREAWAVERARHRQVAADLEQDLSGHKHTLAEVEADRGAKTKVVAELELTCARLEQDLEQEIEERGREAGEAQEVRRTLEADLAEHKKTLGALREELSDLEAMRAFLEGELDRVHAELGERTGELERTRGDLEGHKGVLAETQSELSRTLETARRMESEWQRVENVARLIQAELNRSDANATQLGARLVEREAEIAELRRQLRSRWKNFKRAFGWKKPRF